ncbi:unnamed protein product [Effrenium voratum]|nr:unnamed protein product [Effrenium voratum]
MEAVACEASPQDLASMVWAAAKLGYGSAPPMDVTAENVTAKVAEIRPSSISNIVWAHATLAHLVRPLMDAASCEVIRTVHRQDVRDLANLAFGFATLAALHGPLREALSSEALKKLHRLQPQSIAFLTEVGLDVSTHPELVAKLESIIDQILGSLPTTLQQWRRADLRQDLRIDHLGSVGTRLMLQKAHIEPPAEDFTRRAASNFPRAVAEGPQQRRIFAYAEFRLSVGNGAEQKGRLLREHGFQGLRRWQKGWLKALTLPVNLHVDRSVCAEFQVLNEICDMVSEVGLADDMEGCSLIEGHVQLLVSTTPCLSCVCAAMQFQLLMPKVRLQFGCVQPWQMAGPEPPQRVLEGPRQARPAGSDLSGVQSELICPAAAERLAALRSIDLTHTRTWEELRETLRQSPHHVLAEVLRELRARVVSESRAMREERVWQLLRKTLYQLPIFCVDGSIDFRGCQVTLVSAPWSAVLGLLKAHALWANVDSQEDGPAMTVRSLSQAGDGPSPAWMYRHVGGKQTFYPEPRGPEERSDRRRDEPRTRARARLEVPLSEEQQSRLRAFLARFDACGGLEATLRLVAGEVHTFFPFQACKVLQRLAKRFGAAPSKDQRLQMLAARCASTMPTADAVSLGRSLWALGRLRLRHESLLQAAARRLPAVLEESGPITMATIWHSFEVLQFEDAGCLQGLAQAVIARHMDCDPPEVAIVLHAAAQLQFAGREELVRKLLETVRLREGSFSARHLAVCFHAAAKVGYRDDELCKVVTKRFCHDMADTDALALTSAVYACGMVAYFDEAFFQSAGRWLLARLKERRRLEPQQISNMVYTFGKLGFKHEELLLACAEHAMQDFWRFKPQELDNLTYGMALLKWRHEPFLNALAMHLVEGGRVQQLDCQSLVSMAYSSALLGFSNPVMLRALGDQAVPKLPRFKAEEFSIMVYSLGVLNFRHHDLLSAVVQQVPPVLPKFSTQNMSNLLHGLGLVTFDRDDNFVRLVADHLASRYSEATAQDIANPVTALMRMCIPHQRFFEHTAEFITCPQSPLPLRSFTPQEIANTVYGFDALQVFDQKLFEQAQAELLKRVEDWQSLAPPKQPAPSQYQRDFQAWDLYQVGPDYTQELLEAVGIQRPPWPGYPRVGELLDHYVGQHQESLLSRYGDKLLISVRDVDPEVLPAARWVSSHLVFRLSGPRQLGELKESLVVEPAHPKEEEGNQRRFKAEQWTEQLQIPGGNGHAPFRPVLLSTFLGNWRHRHTEVVALDLVVDRVLQALMAGNWRWHEDFWQELEGEVELLVPHTPCLSCVGALAQLRIWAPKLKIRVLYQDWRDWRKLLRETVAQRLRFDDPSLICDDQHRQERCGLGLC